MSLLDINESEEGEALDPSQYDEENSDTFQRDVNEDELRSSQTDSSIERPSLPSGVSHTIVLRRIPWFSA